jgi:hypothetical protein
METKNPTKLTYIEFMFKHGKPIVLLKNIATAPGSAVASVSSQLVAEDSIDQKLQLSIGICDKGAYLVKVSDVEF